MPVFARIRSFLSYKDPALVAALTQQKADLAMLTSIDATSLAGHSDADLANLKTVLTDLSTGRLSDEVNSYTKRKNILTGLQNLSGVSFVVAVACAAAASFFTLPALGTAAVGFALFGSAPLAAAIGLNMHDLSPKNRAAFLSEKIDLVTGVINERRGAALVQSAFALHAAGKASSTFNAQSDAAPDAAATPAAPKQGPRLDPPI